jgi:Fe-S cluster assembly ATP-binding protein
MKKNVFLSINKLAVIVLDKPVLYGIDLNINEGDIHAIMGPNGSGKSTLAYALMGHPNYTVVSGSVLLNGTNLLALPIYERARAGLFLAFQHPCEIPGVSIASFLKEAYGAVTGIHISVADFQVLLHERCAQLKIDPLFMARSLNDGFSGGEKKRLELLQLLMLRPKLVILDEIDSGLDIDSLKIVADGLALARKENPAMSIILITHYQRILNYITPDYVHVLCDGRIVVSGDGAVAHVLESKGYDAWKNSSI